MLHFPANKLNVVYIGVCDWGEVERLQNMTPSLCLQRNKMPPKQKNCVRGLP
jgi:hypothetical protein